MNVWHDINPGENLTESFKCLIEIPWRSHNKYEIDKETGLLMLDRVMYSSMQYPADYGMIPQTLAEDGDPLDVLLLTTNPLFPMTLVEARPLGMLLMIDDGEMDEKIIAVPLNDPRFIEYKTIDDVPAARKAEIEDFFRTYKSLEKKADKMTEVAANKIGTDAEKLVSYAVKGHKSVDIKGYHGLAKAQDTILACRQRYQAKY